MQSWLIHRVMRTGRLSSSEADKNSKVASVGMQPMSKRNRTSGARRRRVCFRDIFR